MRSALLIGDGVTPGNEGRGYVLRRLIRRAVRSMRLLGVDAPTLELLPVSKDRMKASYPELETGFGRISQIAYAEEDAFRRTLSAGTTILDTAVARAKSSGAPVLGGAEAFALHDTYGFPIDLTLEMAAEQGLQVDEAGLPPAHGGAARPREGRRQGEEERPRRHTGLPPVADAVGGQVEFTGYDQTVTDATVRGIIRGDEVVERVGAGEEIEIVLDRTRSMPSPAASWRTTASSASPTARSSR